MPPKTKTDQPPAAPLTVETDTPGGEVTVPTAAQAAAEEAGVVETAPAPDVPDGMIAIPFRGANVFIPKTSDKGRRAFLYRQAAANYDIDKMLAVVVGDLGTSQIAALITDDDDPTEVIVDFFKALGKATGSGNS